MSIRPLIISLVAVVTATLIAQPAYAANPASFSISSSASSVQTGANVTVNIFENGDNVNVVTTKISYDSSRLQLLGISCGFGSSIAEANGVTCYTAGTAVVNGTVVAASASFKAIGTGAASVSVAGGSKIVSGGTNIWNGSAPSASINVTTPPTPPTTPTTPTTPTNPTNPTNPSNPAANTPSNNAAQTASSNQAATSNDAATSSTATSSNQTSTDSKGTVKGVDTGIVSEVIPNTFWKDGFAYVNKSFMNLWWVWFIILGAGAMFVISKFSVIKAAFLANPLVKRISNINIK